MDNWKKSEEGMHNLVTSSIKSLSDLKRPDNKMSVFDAYNDLAIVEYKFRRGQHYPDTLIEKKKYDNMRMYGSSKVCLYIVHSADTIYIFNLNHLHHIGWDYKWKTTYQPKTTSFGGGRINKLTGYIDWDQAYITICCKTGEVKRKDDTPKAAEYASEEQDAHNDSC